MRNHRLRARGGQIEDRQTRVAERDGAVVSQPMPLRVRPAMGEGRGHVHNVRVDVATPRTAVRQRPAMPHIRGYAPVRVRFEARPGVGISRAQGYRIKLR